MVGLVLEEEPTYQQFVCDVRVCETIALQLRLEHVARAMTVMRTCGYSFEGGQRQGLPAVSIGGWSTTPDVCSDGVLYTCHSAASEEDIGSGLVLPDLP